MFAATLIKLLIMIVCHILNAKLKTLVYHLSDRKKKDHRLQMSLKSCNDVIVKERDKENSAVLLDRVSYVFQMQKIAWRYK